MNGLNSFQKRKTFVADRPTRSQPNERHYTAAKGQYGKNIVYYCPQLCTKLIEGTYTVDRIMLRSACTSLSTVCSILIKVIFFFRLTP